MGKRLYLTLAVGFFTGAACMGTAAAQTPLPWHVYNRYVELSAGQHQQNYREQDTNGLTADGVLDTETGHQDHIAAALRWQTENGWLLNLQAQRETGPTNYNGYLQTSSGLTPYRAITGNTAHSTTAQLGYALNSSTWAAMPDAWQLVPLLQISRHHWQRNLVQYGETYQHNTHAIGALVQWQARPGTVLEAQAMVGRAHAASVNVPSLGFAASQPGGHLHEWQLGLNQDLAALTGNPIYNDWRLSVRYARSQYSHGMSPVVNGLQAPPNSHHPVSWTLGLQKQF